MREETKQWFEQSEADLKTANVCYEGKRYYAVVFFCQQTVEKALKALFLEQKKTSPGTTHSLLFLATETNVPKKFYVFLRRLTPQFVNTRYPDAAFDAPVHLYDQVLAEEFLKETEELFRWINSEMRK